MARPISSKGIKKTKKILKFLEETKKNIPFNEVLCSPSRRTKETLNLLLDNISNKPKIYFLKDLYYSSGFDIFRTVATHAKKSKVLVVSHEPLLSDSISNFFIGSQNKHYLNAKAEYTTSAFFNVSFNCSDWGKIRKSNSSINFYVKPKDL